MKAYESAAKKFNRKSIGNVFSRGNEIGWVYDLVN